MVENLRLEKSIGVLAYNRPIKIAYLVPTAEDARTHWILDAIFYESYTRWGGINTLIIPISSDQFESNGYEKWLRAFDPDFVYSYAGLKQGFIKKVDAACLPISFLNHPKRGETPETRWRDLSPDWARYFNPVRSVSTLLSLNNPRSLGQPPPSPIRTLLTQSVDPPNERFLPDNFGVSHDVSAYTNPVHGLFDTACYVGPEKAGFKAGSRELHSVTEALAEISSGKLLTFASLARVHTDGLNRVEPYSWSQGFLVFIGETCKDRINFWNSRLLVPGWIGNPGALLVRKTAFEDESFVKELGNYLNKFNFQRNGNHPAVVELRSLSETRDELTKVQKKMQGKTWSQTSIPSNFDSLACPTEKEISESRYARRNPVIFRLTENTNEIQAQSPSHFEYNNAAFSFLNAGVWAIDLDIERHNNLSRYSNVVDSWQLPRNLKACSAFTKRLSKVSLGHLLTLIPASQDQNFDQQADRRRTYDLRLPSDLNFFRHMVVGSHPRDQSDLRNGLYKLRYVGLGHSDKGQNLRGVASMFEHFEDSYKLLTNKLWREGLRKYGHADSVRESQLHGLIPSDRDFKQGFSKKYQIDRKVVTQYLQAALSDSLEYLVERGVLFQLHKWRCDYCGHINAKSFDDLKKENSCSICKNKYFAPIDVAWEFKFNSFVADSLVARNGLTVLWALGYLHQSLFRGSFYYLPEANLFYEENGNENREEIDILSVGSGKFLIGEAKKSVTSFLRKDGELAKFVNKVKSLNPDIALLIFEDFAENPNEVAQVKTELEGARNTILKETGLDRDSLRIVVASELHEFQEYGEDFGFQGNRVEEILYPKKS